MRFYKWAGISVLMHAAVILPLMFTAFSVPLSKPREVKLELDLFSMVSDRFVEEISVEQTEEAPIIQEPPAPPEQKPEPEELTFQVPDEPAPEPVAAVEPPTEPIEEPMEEPPQPEPIIENPTVTPGGSVAGAVVETAAADVPGGSGVFLPASGNSIGGPGGGDGSGGGNAATRGGDTPRRGNTGTADPLAGYTSIVVRRLQANLVYPEKMRRNGVEAITTIAFTVTESGQIKKDSLRVRKSSGYKEMDDNALRAARDSAPFSEPPKEMTLVIDVAFEVGRTRR